MVLQSIRIRQSAMYLPKSLLPSRDQGNLDSAYTINGATEPSPIKSKRTEVQGFEYTTSIG